MHFLLDLILCFRNMDNLTHLDSHVVALHWMLDEILALRLLGEIHQPLHVASVELKTAFDSVKRVAPLMAM